jgi:hypothetical protein
VAEHFVHDVAKNRSQHTTEQRLEGARATLEKQHCFDQTGLNLHTGIQYQFGEYFFAFDHAGFGRKPCRAMIPLVGKLAVIDFDFSGKKIDFAVVTVVNACVAVVSAGVAVIATVVTVVFLVATVRYRR